MRLSRAVSSAMTTPTPLPRGPGGTRRTAERLSAGRPRPACNPAPDGPGRALAHSPGSGPAADTEEKKVGGGSGSARICLGHVEADVDGCRQEPETIPALPPGRARAGPGNSWELRIRRRVPQARAPEDGGGEGRCNLETHGQNEPSSGCGWSLSATSWKAI